MSDKVAALMEEFNDQIRIAPRLADERAGSPRGRAERADGEPVVRMDRSDAARHYGSRRARS